MKQAERVFGDESGRGHRTAKPILEGTEERKKKKKKNA